MKKILVITTIVLISSFSSKAQDTLTGTLSSWDQGKADIIMSMTGEPIVIGTVDGSGTFRIPLTDEILEKTKVAMEAYNKSSSKARFGLNTLDKGFSCRSEDSLEVKNGDQQPVNLAVTGKIPVGNLNKRKEYGYFMALSSRAFAKPLASYGAKGAVKGFYLDWYYVQEPASIEGTCHTKMSSWNQKDSFEETKVYDLDLDKGWNIVKISIEDTYTDSDGETYASGWIYQTVDKIPEETEYIYFKNDR